LVVFVKTCGLLNLAEEKSCEVEELRGYSCKRTTVTLQMRMWTTECGLMFGSRVEIPNELEDLKKSREEQQLVLQIYLGLIYLGLARCLECLIIGLCPFFSLCPGAPSLLHYEELYHRGIFTMNEFACFYDESMLYVIAFVPLYLSVH